MIGGQRRFAGGQAQGPARSRRRQRPPGGARLDRRAPRHSPHDREGGGDARRLAVSARARSRPDGSAKGTVTVEKVAANAVMAGCRPEYFPVVVAAVKAVLQEQFHVGSGACTTGGSAPVVIVNGSIARRLGINSGTACLGGNVKANATIGRALRLVMRNLGGAKPEAMEKSTQAWPGKLLPAWPRTRAALPGSPSTWSRVPAGGERGHGSGGCEESTPCVRARRAKGTECSGPSWPPCSARDAHLPPDERRHPLDRAPVPRRADEIAPGRLLPPRRAPVRLDHQLPVRELEGRGYWAPAAGPR